ncbi:hypothetical protein A3A95_00470 [Candidatus Nomurabacteria bacterium RIFCSPLOWO2_01_FULL_39_18]|uniref:Fibronectin type-III domain-containing protein n=1 Tax=Candidatus Nomurabacteria bacterium RIFCSPHIGHO2_01_FULL_40_24b TaxID=1801739 RepID=A0A1F6V9I6_9BACT|nr:MAG: hypothetical protein A2647_03320 [Candidatus Nomurabacteria bacterium RIFCSPHIGHO2_01_FULL_40_24b]OGI90547.1 MAG: hypothetical protein A3A95_00470 [Candidatus Nomurabacteria bacterium RIFCSPLOWO2_01_FULL_39_18]
MVSKLIKSAGNFFISAMLFMTFLGVLSFPIVAKAADEPDTTTRSATNVTDESAVLNGRVDGNGAYTYAWFEWGRDRDLDDSTFDVVIGSGTKNFDIRITGLRENTTYYFRAIAENDEGIDRGSILSFRTDRYSNFYYDEDDYYYSNNDGRITSDDLTAITDGATEVGNTSAQLNSLIISSVDSPTNAWFEWGTTPSLGNRTAEMSVGSLPAVRHAHTLLGLTPGRIYYFRAVAENSYWRNYGSVLSFVTNEGTVEQNVNTIIIREPVIVEIPAPATAVEENEKKDNSVEDQPETTRTSPIGANVYGAGFLPGSLLGWLLLLILVLMAVMLFKYIWDHSSKSQK